MMVQGMASLPKLAVAFINFGPYHLARLQSLSKLAQERGLEVWGLELCAGEADYPWQVEKFPLHFRHRTLFPGRRLADLSALNQARGMFLCLEDLRPQALALAGYSLAAMWAGLAWAKLRRRPIVVMGESAAADLPRAKWRETLKRWLVSRFDAALGGGAPQRSYFHALGIPAHRIFPGYDVVDNDHFGKNAQAARAKAEAGRAALGLPHSYFLSVSRFVAKKNLLGLVAAYARYRELSTAPWDLVLCGAGPEEERLRNRARHLPGVHFAGFRQADILPTYYGLAKCFILPSIRNEPWGLVVNEAMAAGLPVLVSRACGCCRDLVAEGVNGFTFAPGDLEALARLMATMASGRLDLGAMGAASRSIIAHWTPGVFARNLLRAVDAASCR
jgi:glycosyltransferase involved in cell wall biosynthesis